MTRLVLTPWAAQRLTLEDRAEIVERAPADSAVQLGFGRTPKDGATCRIFLGRDAVAAAFGAPSLMAAFRRAMAQYEGRPSLAAYLPGAPIGVLSRGEEEA